MADYRDFCGQCGGELNFGGGHRDFCSIPAENEQRRAAEEKQYLEELEAIASLGPERVIEEYAKQFIEVSNKRSEISKSERQLKKYREVLQRTGHLPDALERIMGLSR